MAKSPIYKEIKIRQGSIDDLINIYKSAYKRITKELIDASEAGKIQRARVLARVNYELEQLGVDVNAWVKKEIPQYYLDGANVATQDLRALGVDISKVSNYAVINTEAIKALTDDVALSFANAITGISRNANSLLSSTLKQQLNFIIADGRLSGDARKTISANLTQKLTDEGLTALQDKAGKNWTFENYTRMLARTKATEARNQGLTNRMLASGYDLVQVSNHNSSHPACADWEGQILSLTGETPGYPTLDEASFDLFHPNCEHAINVITPDIAELTNVYDNPYNYDDAEASDIEFKGPGAAGVKTQHIDVFHGAGGNTVPAGNDLFGGAFYVARDKSTAAEFGSKIVESTLNIKPSEILTISTDAEYNKLVLDAIKKYPITDAQVAIPKFARDLGYKAIEGTPSYDPLAGIAILDRNLLSKA